MSTPSIENVVLRINIFSWTSSSSVRYAVRGVTSIAVRKCGDIKGIVIVENICLSFPAFFDAQTSRPVVFQMMKYVSINVNGADVCRGDSGSQISSCYNIVPD